MIFITDQNAFYLRVTAQTKAGSQMADVDLSVIKWLVAQFVRRGRSLQSMEIDSQGRAVIFNSGDLAMGVYGVEFNGYYNGQPWRFFEKKVFAIVDQTVNAVEQSGEINGIPVFDVTLTITLGGEGVPESYVTNAINEHDNDMNAHPYLQELIENAGEVDDVKVNGLSVVNENKEANINITATIDGNVGEPEVDVEQEDGEIRFAFKNMKGEKGETGAEGRQGPQGDSFQPIEDVSGLVLAHTTGDNNTKAMSQRGVTNELDNIVTNGVIVQGSIPVPAGNPGSDRILLFPHLEVGKTYIFEVTLESAATSYVGCYLFESTTGNTLVSLQGPNIGETYYRKEYTPEAGTNYQYLNCWSEDASTISFSFREKLDAGARIDAVSKGVFFGDEKELISLPIIIGDRQCSYNGGIATSQPTVTTRATAYNYFLKSYLTTFHSVIIPDGWMMSFFFCKKLVKTTSSSDYGGPGWLDGKEIVFANYLSYNFPYVCLNFRKRDNTAISSAELEYLQENVKVTKYNGKNIHNYAKDDFYGNLTPIKVLKPADTVQVNILKGKVWYENRGYLDDATNRAAFETTFQPDFIKEYHYITVPEGYDFGLNSFLNTEPIPNNGINTYNGELWGQGWMNGGGTFDISWEPLYNFPHIGCNFRRTDGEDITDSDIATLNTGVYFSKNASNVGFRSLKIYGNGNNVIGGIDNPSGIGEIAVQSIGTFNLNSNDYTPVHTNASYVDLTAHRCFKKWEYPSSVCDMNSSSPQGSAIYGNYLFQYFVQDTKLRVFDLETGRFISAIELTDVAHGNSMQFGEVVQYTGFPLLYISGSAPQDSVKDKIYVTKVSLSTAEVVRTITLDSHNVGLQDCAFDWHNEKMYVTSFVGVYDGEDVTIIRYDVAGLEDSTAETFTPTFEAENIVGHLGVNQGVTFFNNTFVVLASEWNETVAYLYFIDKNTLSVIDTWSWAMSVSSECQGVTPVYQDGRYILVIPAWWKNTSSDSEIWKYRLMYIN